MPARTVDNVPPSSSSPSSSSASSFVSLPTSASDQAGPSGSRRPLLPPILPLSAFPHTGTPRHSKPGGYDFYRDVLKSPKYIVAPMVSASELPWRTLSRRYGADLCYSPMINCRSLIDSLHGKSKTSRAKALEWFDVDGGEEGQGEDSMLVVQLAGSDPKLILEAAEHVQDHCLAVDLNLGCPQHIAKRGHYGSYLQEDWPLIFNIINTLHLNLRVPVTAKMRVFDDVERTVAYAKMLQHAGAQIVTVHGRTREQKGHNTGVADWKKIRAVKEALHVPVFANGNVLYGEDLQRALDKTGADGVMSAEGNLYNPTIFSSTESRRSMPSEIFPHREDGSQPHAEWAPFPYIPAIANAYLDEVVRFKTKAEPGAVKGHIFKICRPALEKHTDIRASIGKAKMLYAKADTASEADEAQEAIVTEYREAMKLLDERLMADRKDTRFFTRPPISSASLPPTEQRYIPHWLCQPYFRPPLPEQPTKNEQGAPTQQLCEDKSDEYAIAQGDAQAVASKDFRKAGASKANGIVEPNDVQSQGEKRVMRNTPTGAADVEATDGSDEGTDQKRLRDLQIALSSASDLKAQANILFERKLYDEAVAMYLDALGVLPVREQGKSDEELEEEGEVAGKKVEEDTRGDHEEDKGGQDVSWVDQLSTSAAPQPSARTVPERNTFSAQSDVPVQQVGSGLVEVSEEEARTIELSTNVARDRGNARDDLGQEGEEHAATIARLEGEVVELRTVCYSNCAAAYLKLEQYEQARHSADQALLDTPNHLKSLHRRSQALGGLVSSHSSSSSSSSSSAPPSLDGRSALLSQYLTSLQTLASHPSLPRPLLHTLLQRDIPRVRSELEEEQTREKEEMVRKLKEVGDKFLGWFGLSTDNFKMEKAEGGGYGMKFQR